MTSFDLVLDQQDSPLSSHEDLGDVLMDMFNMDNGEDETKLIINTVQEYEEI